MTAPIGIKERKIYLKKILCMALSAIMLLSIFVPAFAVQNPINEAAQAIAVIEDELAESNTSVLAELTEMKARLTDAEQIAVIDDMIEEYAVYQNGTLAVPYGSFHLIYSPAVSAVVAYFNSQGYVLSAELLAHAKDNNVLDSAYTPSNGALMTQTAKYTELCSNGLTSGTANFVKTGATIDDDFYYAIHACTYAKDVEANTITVTDRYDFAPNDWSDIQGVAVDTMYKAQEAGVIVPFQLSITVSM